jgi:hypothetical protein
MQNRSGPGIAEFGFRKENNFIPLNTSGVSSQKVGVNHIL